MADAPGNCIPGLHGYPVQFSNLPTSIAGFTVPITELELQFSPTNIPMRFANGVCNPETNSTFILSGTRYTVRAILYSESGQEGLSRNSMTSAAEFQIWGVSDTALGDSYKLAVLNIPIFIKPQPTEAGNAIISAIKGEAITLEKCVPQGQAISQIALYSTCIETDKRKTAQIAVAYWTYGVSITQEISTSLESIKKVKAKSIPPILDLSAAQSVSPKLLTSYSIDASGQKKNRVYGWWGLNETAVWTAYTQPPIPQLYLLKPFTEGSPTSASTTNLRFISQFILPPKVNRSTQAFKCRTINPETDIKDGNVLIDVRTGRSLDQVLEDEQMSLNTAAAGSTPPANTVYATGTVIAIVFGVIIGLGILALIIYILYNWMTKGGYTTPLQAVSGLVGPAAAAAKQSAFTKIASGAMPTKVWVSIVAVGITLAIMASLSASFAAPPKRDT